MQIYQVSNRRRARRTEIAVGPADSEMKISSQTGDCLVITCREVGHDFVIEMSVAEARALALAFDRYAETKDKASRRRTKAQTRSFLA